MSFYHDKQIRRYIIFNVIFSVLMLALVILYVLRATDSAKAMYLKHDASTASFLLENGVPQNITAAALLNSKVSESGEVLLTMAGIEARTSDNILPFISSFRNTLLITSVSTFLLLALLLFMGLFAFLETRRRLYIQAENVLDGYENGNYSVSLPQNDEGALSRLFSKIRQLAEILKAKSETEYDTKEFLKSTISNISHQLKTPLAALVMYQEIIETGYSNPDTVKHFSARSGEALKRMERLIQSMLKLARLDAGNIIFEKHPYSVSEIVSQSINELSHRALAEGKKICVAGRPEQLVCDIGWTSEAIGNIVKNALDHTSMGGIIRISWEHTPSMLRIIISDNGDGIAPEDIYHVFKRFYRSKHSLDTQGSGLGLPLAKSIVEGQNGSISVQSSPGEGTSFTISFLTAL